MRQRIVAGREIETATPTEIAQLLSAIRQEDPTYHKEPFTVDLDATGAGQRSLKLTRRYGWVCERIAVAGLAGALVNFFHNQASSGTDLAESVVIPASGFYTDSFDNRLYVPAGNQLIVVVSAGTVSGQLTGNIQARLRDENPNAEG